MEFNPHKYQDYVIERMTQDLLALLLDPGMGKTPICLMDYLLRSQEMWAERALVVAPLRACYSVWPREGQKWDQFRDIDIRVIHGETRTVEEVNAADIAVINPRGLKWLQDNRANIRPFDTIYGDESTMFKKAGSQRSEQVNRIIRGTPKKSKLWSIPRRFILTGTPAPNGLIDLYGQFGVINNAILGSSLERFYFDFQYKPRMTDYGGVWEPTLATPQMIFDRIAPYAVRLDARDHLDLPQVVHVERRIDLPSNVRRLYKQLEDEMYIELDGRDVAAVNAGVLVNKCHQVANGQVYYTEIGEVAATPTREYATIHTGKTDALMDLWAEIGQKPTLVVYEFKPEIIAIEAEFQRRFGFKPPHIGGDTSGPEGARLVTEWNEGNLPILCVQPQSAAHGLNLQDGGNHLAFYSELWDLELYMQIIDRLVRQGQKEDRVFIHHIIANNTVDDTIMRARAGKAEVQDELFDYLREERR